MTIAAPLADTVRVTEQASPKPATYLTVEKAAALPADLGPGRFRSKRVVLDGNNK